MKPGNQRDEFNAGSVSAGRKCPGPGSFAVTSTNVLKLDYRVGVNLLLVGAANWATTMLDGVLDFGVRPYDLKIMCQIQIVYLFRAY